MKEEKKRKKKSGNRFLGKDRILICLKILGKKWIAKKGEIQANPSVSPSKKPHKLSKKIPAPKVVRLLWTVVAVAVSLFQKLSQLWQWMLFGMDGWREKCLTNKNAPAKVNQP